MRSVWSAAGGSAQLALPHIQPALCLLPTLSPQIITRVASTRVAKFAFEYARKNNRKKASPSSGPWLPCAAQPAWPPQPSAACSRARLPTALPLPALAALPPQVTAVHKANIMKLADGLFIK